MKNLLIILISTLFCLESFGQSEQLEKDYINSLIGKRPSEEIQQMAQEWNALLLDVGGYPELPINKETGRIEYLNIFDLEGIDKPTIFNRIKEFSALSFGSLSSVLHYENFETGKIILKGNFKLSYLRNKTTIGFWGQKKEKQVFDQARCEETYIFTIKEGKLKVEVIDLEYIVNYKMYGSVGSGVVSNVTDRVFQTELYPLAKNDPSSWKGNLNLMIISTQTIKAFISSFADYIKENKNDYDF